MKPHQERWQKEHRQQKEKLGLCYRCDEPVEPGRKHCKKHLKMYSDSAKRRQQERKKSGLCIICGKRPPRPNRVMCQQCADNIGQEKYVEKKNMRRKKLVDSWIASGLCRTCGKQVAPGRKFCKKHLESARERARINQNTNKKNGLCPYCGNPPRPGFTLCENCRSRAINGRRKNKCGGNWNAVMRRDNYRCQICGRVTELNAHHIDGNGEGSLNPNHSIDNLIVLCSGCHSSITKFRSSQHNKELAVRLIMS